MWLTFSEKALCKQFLWLKMIIICQLQHALQRGTSVPHFCHLSHIAMACFTHWQNCKGWEVWLWSWDHSRQSLHRKGFSLTGERCCSVGKYKQNESTTYTQVGMNDSRKGHLSYYGSQMVGKNRVTEKAHPVLCCIDKPPLQDSRLLFEEGRCGQTRQSPQDSHNHPKHEHEHMNTWT